MKIVLTLLTSICLLASSPAASGGWQAGAVIGALALVAGVVLILLESVSAKALHCYGYHRADITPKESVPLAGYNGTRMSQQVEHPIWLKALALRDDSGETSVLVTADLVGLSDKMIAVIAKNAAEKHGVPRERLILNTSHNHSCPVTEDVLWLYYEFTPAETVVKERYTAMVYAKYD